MRWRANGNVVAAIESGGEGGQRVEGSESAAACLPLLRDGRYGAGEAYEHLLTSATAAVVPGRTAYL